MNVLSWVIQEANSDMSLVYGKCTKEEVKDEENLGRSWAEVPLLQDLSLQCRTLKFQWPFRVIGTRTGMWSAQGACDFTQGALLS